VYQLLFKNNNTITKPEHESLVMLFLDDEEKTEFIIVKSLGILKMAQITQKNSLPVSQRTDFFFTTKINQLMLCKEIHNPCFRSSLFIPTIIRDTVIHVYCI
jgi:hypothetical protein